MKKVIAVCEIVLGILMPVMAIIGYFPEPELVVEFSCLSNVVTGIWLIIDGILKLKGKKIPVRFFGNSCVGLFVVFAICMGSLTGAYHMNFKDPVFLMVYFLFDFILGKARGYFVYGFFDEPGFGILQALIFGVVVYILLFGVGGIFLLLNKIFHHKKTE